MLRVFILAAAVAFPNLSFFAQNESKSDSLRRVLQTEIVDTQRVDLLFSLASEVYFSNPKQAEQICSEALTIAERAQFPKGRATGYGWLAYLNEQKGEFGKALDFYEKSFQLSEKQGDRKDMAVCLNNMAAIFKDQGLLEKSLDYHQRSLVFRQQMGDSLGIATSLNNIGLLFFNQGKIREALDFYSKSLKIEEKMGKPDGLMTVLMNIGDVHKDQEQFSEARKFYQRALKIAQKSEDKYGLGGVYNHLGRLFDEQGRLDSAMFFYHAALRVRSEIDDRQGASHTLKNLGNIYQKQGRLGEARDCFQKSLDGFETIGDKWGIAISSNRLGELSMVLDKNWTLAEQFLSRSLRLARELGYPADIAAAAQNLQKIYRKKGNWQAALDLNDLAVAMRDSVQNDDLRKTALKTQLHYEYELREAAYKNEQEKKDAVTRAEIRQQRIIRNVLIVSFLGAVFSAFFIFKQRNRLAAAKRRSDQLLLNILPAETARELKTTGAAKAKRYESVTVLFTDFTNFTQAAELLSPEDLVAEIHHCYSEFDKIIARHGTEKIKTIGDSYMAAGGLPAPNETHAADVVRAALEIREFVEVYFQISPLGQQGGGIRIGIHTGAVVAGIVGIDKFAYDIWGDTVNVASRMESSGVAGRVNVSEATFRLLGGEFLGEARGMVGVKNKGELEMYFVEGRKAAAVSVSNFSTGENEMSTTPNRRY